MLTVVGYGTAIWLGLSKSTSCYIHPLTKAPVRPYRQHTQDPPRKEPGAPGSGLLGLLTAQPGRPAQQFPAQTQLLGGLLLASCPVCNVSMPPAQLAQHMEAELAGFLGDDNTTLPKASGQGSCREYETKRPSVGLESNFLILPPCI